MNNKCIVVLLFVLAIFGPVMPVFSQVEERVYKRDYKIDTTNCGSLCLELDNISFFKDNEFGGTVMKGYSLPGVWLQPKVVYYPLKNIKLELGMHALIYSGAYKYPNFAYHDIAFWKGWQYQKGAHVLPFFRAQVAFSRLNLVLGNIYGASTHELIEPLYHPELTLTADPEMGIQVLYDSHRWHLDAWVNWQSYIFEEDTHQEAFTVGLSNRLFYNSQESRFHFYSPIQVTLQHRGGEQDTLLTNSVQTLMNGAVGIGTTWNIHGKVLKRVNWEMDILGYYQQAGNLWPYDKGLGFYTALYADLKNVRLKAGYSLSRDFISLFGIPYFGSVSTKYEGAVYDNPHTFFGSLEYSRCFGKHYAVGIKADVWQYSPEAMIEADGVKSHPGNSVSFSVGVYFRANPSFFLFRR